MRFSRKNKRVMWYALFVDSEPIYVLDDDGNKIVVDVIDGTEYYAEAGQSEPHYEEAQEIKAIFKLGGENVTLNPYGINQGEYDAIMVLEGNSSPIDEKSLIWVDMMPLDTNKDKADYEVVKKLPSLNTTFFVLKKVVG